LAYSPLLNGIISLNINIYFTRTNMVFRLLEETEEEA